MVEPIKLLLLISAFIVGFSPTGSAQEITITDEVSQQQIPNATVYSLEPYVKILADINGRFQLERFIGCDTIYVSYPEYAVCVFSYEELRKVTDIVLSDDLLSVGETVVRGNRWEQDKIDIPGKITTLNMRDAELISPQTSADLLESSGFVFVQKSQLAGGSPQLRGFGTNRVLITVDGVRMNNAIFRSGNLQNVISLDANSLESVEIQFGPGAVTYGSDAIGGIMNFRTKVAMFSPDSLKTFTRTNISSRYSSASNEINGHFDINIGKRKWAFLTAATYSRYGDLKAGEFGNDAFLRPSYQTTIDGVDTTLINDDPSLQVNSGFSQMNIIQKIRFKPSDKLEFDYSVNYSATSDAPRYDRLILDTDADGVLDKAEWYYGPQRWMMHKFGMLHSRKNGIYNHMRLTAAYQNFQESRHDRKTNSTSIRRQYEEVNALSINLDFDKVINPVFTLYYGLEGIGNLVKSNAYREEVNIGDNPLTGEISTINSRYPNGSTWQAYGGFVNLKYLLSEKWSLNGGARYSYYEINADFDTTLFAYPVRSTKNANSALNASLGLVFKATNNFQFFTNASTGFRAPNIDDLGKVFDSEPGSVIVPNIELRPEYAYNAEVGFVLAIKNKVKIEGAIYYTYLKDALARANFSFNGQDSILYEGTLSNVQAVQNVADATVYGFQGEIDWAITKGLTLRTTISYQIGTEFNIDSATYFPHWPIKHANSD
jgi:hemoglobin/transferrin/lactoferrin receptor protein